METTKIYLEDYDTDENRAEGEYLIGDDRFLVDIVASQKYKTLVSYDYDTPNEVVYDDLELDIRCIKIVEEDGTEIKVQPVGEVLKYVKSLIEIENVGI